MYNVNTCPIGFSLPVSSNITTNVHVMHVHVHCNSKHCINVSIFEYSKYSNSHQISPVLARRPNYTLFLLSVLCTLDMYSVSGMVML